MVSPLSAGSLGAVPLLAPRPGAAYFPWVSARLLRCEAERELNFFDAFGPTFSLLGPTPFHCKSVKQYRLLIFLGRVRGRNAHLSRGEIS